MAAPAAAEDHKTQEEISLLMKTHHHKHQGFNTFGWNTRRNKILSISNRRRKVPSVRLGGKKKPISKRGSIFLVRLFRKMKLRWLKLQYSCLLKKLKSYYYSMVKDLIEAGATLQSVQQRIMMETYFTVPVMGVSIASIPHSYRTGSALVH